MDGTKLFRVQGVFKQTTHSRFFSGEEEGGMEIKSGREKGKSFLCKWAFNPCWVGKYLVYLIFPPSYFHFALLPPLCVCVCACVRATASPDQAPLSSSSLLHIRSNAGRKARYREGQSRSPDQTIDEELEDWRGGRPFAPPPPSALPSATVGFSCD